MNLILISITVTAARTLLVLLMSIHRIGPADVGLVNKRLAIKTLDDDDPIAFFGEAGYQAQLLMPGLRFKLWPVYGVSRHRWVQVPAGEIGVVIAQVGEPLPIGAKSAVYKPEFGNFSDLGAFVTGGGQKGVQRPVLPPGALLPIHPVAFLVITSREVYGAPVSPDLAATDELSPESFGLTPEDLQVVVIAPGGEVDVDYPGRPPITLTVGATAAESPQGPARRRSGGSMVSASSPPSKGRRWKRATSPPGWVASATWTDSKPSR